MQTALYAVIDSIPMWIVTDAGYVVIPFMLMCVIISACWGLAWGLDHAREERESK